MARNAQNWLEKADLDFLPYTSMLKSEKKK